MTNRKQDTVEDQPRLQTVSDQLKWEAKYKPALDQKEGERNRRLDEAEAERMASATDAIIVEFRQLRKLGYSRDDAGAVMAHRWHPGCDYTWTDLVMVLHALGSNPLRSNWHPGRV